MSALSPVLAVKIDSLAPARPQTGLTDANVGHVLPVEGGLSRILAPVRLAPSVTRPGLAGTCGAALCECVVRLGGSGVNTDMGFPVAVVARRPAMLAMMARFCRRG